LAANDYHFITKWRVPGTVEEVYDILTEPKDLPRWWPSVYLDVLEIQSGEPDDVHKVVRLETKGWLPYKLNWHFTVTDSNPPHDFGLKAWGDFEGTGHWYLAQDGDFVDVTYDWRVKAEKPLLKLGSPIFKPIFAMNHRWAMARGEESLKLELERRRAATEATRALVPAPPPPTPMPSTPLLLGAGLVLTFLFMRGRRRRRRR
jgi:hypothetical protein